MALRTSAASGPAGQPRAARWSVPPVLVRQIRGGVVESVHRGDIVEADATGRLIRVTGDPDRASYLRSCGKPFGLLALLRAGGVEELDLTTDELAIMTASHSGEDLHVRTIQALYRRVGIPQSALICGADSTPMDPLTAARLARDGERPSQLRHMCSGQHSALILTAKLGGWDLETYWRPEHPAHVAYRQAIADAFDVPYESLRAGIDGCGIETYAFTLRQTARAYALLADPSAVPARDHRAALAPHLTRIRDAMVRHPDLVAGTRDRLDTSLMKAAPKRLVAKSGMEALQCVGILPGPRGATVDAPASGLAAKIEDGDGFSRGLSAATVESLRQAGVLEGQALRVLARYHRPPSLDPHGRLVGEAVPEFELAPVGELIG